MVFKQSKRPFSDDEPCQISYKHPKQLSYGSHQHLFAAVVPDAPDKPGSSGEGEEIFVKGHDEESFASHTTDELSDSDEKEFERSAFGDFSGLSWVRSNNTAAEEGRTEPAFDVSCFPGFLDDGHPSRVFVRSDETYLSYLDNPSRRLVALGPNHQADIPEWGSLHTRHNSGCLNLPAPALDADSDANDPSPPLSTVLPLVPLLIEDDSDDQKLLMGTCIIPMPDANNCREVGSGRTDCSCLDRGSVRCVRQHVVEAREKLQETLGQKRFVELGFYDMGEAVVQKWSKEEEQVFHDVVLSNPSSSGKNFWDKLSLVFPARTMKELVSYYFNVFMLRIRAEQNRLDPSNIDSDDDEWQGSDDGDMFAITEEDEDSVVGSPVDDQTVVIYNASSHEDDDCSSDNDGDVAGEHEGRLGEDSEVHTSYESNSGKSPYSHSSIPVVRLMSNNLRNSSEDQDAQDDSCTSYESQIIGARSDPPSAGEMQESQVETDHGSWHNEYINDCLTDVDHGYILEPCDVKLWDIGFINGPRKDVDLLPTCNMIEEVFGDGTWHDNKMWDNLDV